MIFYTWDAIPEGCVVRDQDGDIWTKSEKFPAFQTEGMLYIRGDDVFDMIFAKIDLMGPFHSIAFR